MRDSESNCQASGESTGLLGKRVESVPLNSLSSGGTKNEPPQEERIQVRVDHTGNTLSPENDARIFEVVARGDNEALSDLLKTDMTSVCAIDEEGNTALHHAVKSACQYGVSDGSFYHCINVLMNCQQININMPNKNGYTAIGLAVHHLHKKCIEHMLQHPSAGRLHLDNYPGDSESTVREIIVETYPDLDTPLTAPLMENLDSTDRNKKLLAALQHDKYNIFFETLGSKNPNPWYDEPYHSSLLEIACQIKKRERFVELLLDNGADPKIKNEVTGMPLLHETARSGNFEVLQLLLEKEGDCLEDNEQRTILHWLARVSERKSNNGLEDCLNRLLRPDCSWNVNTEDRDRWGNTALYITVERGFRDRAKLLLSKGADIRVFERGSKILLSDSVSIVKEFLDDCLQSNDKPLTSIDLKLRLNYQSVTNIVPCIADSKFHSHLLAHPVMKTFLILKWEKLRFVFLSDVGFYLTFLLFLTAYILVSETNNTVNGEGAARNTTGPFSFNDSSIKSRMNDSRVISQLQGRDKIFLWLSLMALLSLLTLREAVQMLVHRWVHVKSLENWLETLLIIATFISCSGVVDGMKIKSHFSAVALLLGWFELLLMSGRLPLLSVQQTMFRRVSLTFLSYMMAYVPLLIGFALSFYILFKGSDEQDGTKLFPNPVISVQKTIIMFSGEFDASDLSFDTLPFTSNVIFLLFVVLVAIILLNLLNGLAVNDTEEITKVAETLSLESRVRLFSRIEGLVNALPKRMKPDIELREEMFVIYPNQWSRIGSAAVQSLLSIISERTKSEEKDKSTAFQKEWRMFTEKLSELQILHEKLQKKFESILNE
jgi:ankyrin repeat protein